MEVGPAWRSQKSAFRGLLPQSVREVIRARLSRLSAEASGAGEGRGGVGERLRLRVGGGRGGARRSRRPERA